MIRFIYLLFLMATITQAGAKEIRRIVVTIKPIHSLVSSIMEGVDAPEVELLLQDNQSPHTHQLRPSEAQKLDTADVVIWVGDVYEMGLAKRIKFLASRAELITITELPGIQLYPNRTFDESSLCAKNCCNHCHQGEEEHDDHHHDHTTNDGHLWLAPNNAKAIVVALTQKLMTLDPKHAGDYKLNSEKTLAKINDLTLELTEEVVGLKAKKYMLIHDFTQYFDRFFGTKAVGVIRVNPSLEPTPKHLREISETLTAGGADCLFGEPQFSNKLVSQLVKDTGVNYETLDYLGLDLEAGPNCYFEIMRRLVVNMKKGLKVS